MSLQVNVISVVTSMSGQLTLIFSSSILQDPLRSGSSSSEC